MELYPASIAPGKAREQKLSGSTGHGILPIFKHNRCLIISTKFPRDRWQYDCDESKEITEQTYTLDLLH